MRVLGSMVVFGVASRLRAVLVAAIVVLVCAVAVPAPAAGVEVGAPTRFDPSPVAVGVSHACALPGDGTVRCWGAMNTRGQLGDGTEFDPTAPIGDSFPRPVTVIAETGSAAPLSGAVAIAAGYAHSCAVLADGTVRCWGWNSSSDDPFAAAGTGGQLGDGTTTDRLAPVTVVAEAGSTTPLSGVTDIVAGWFHTCALIDDGTVRCWGDATFRGGLGDGTRDSSLTPVTVIAEAGATAPLTGVIALATGDFKTCALLGDGTVKCWGDDYVSQLSEAATEDTAPVTVAATSAGDVPLSGVIAIDVAGGFTQDAGGYVACALLSDGNVKCWGNNDFGGLGDGTTTSSRIPVDVVGITEEATAITAGCALLADATVTCWTGRSPEGEVINSPFTVTPAGGGTAALSGVAVIEAGDFHTAAVLADGSVVRWLGNEGAVPIDGLLVIPPVPAPAATPVPTAAPAAATASPPAATVPPAPSAGAGGQPATGDGDPAAGGDPDQPTAMAFRESVPTPAEITLDPVVLAQTVFIAAAVMLFIPFPSTLFNNTLEEHYPEIVGRVRAARARQRALLRRLSHRIRPPSPRAPAAMATEPEPMKPEAVARADFWRTTHGIALFVLVSALLGSFLDPTLALDWTSVATFAGLTLGLVVLLVASNVVPAIAYKRSGVEFFAQALPGTLAVGVACVLISRYTDFQPGYLYGLIVGLTAARGLGLAGEGRKAAVGTVVMLAVAGAAWIGLWWLSDLTPVGVEPALPVAALLTAFTTIVVGGLEGAVIGLVPARFLPGDKVKSWDWRVWLGLFLVAEFAFLLVLVNPTSGYLADSSRTPLLTILGLLLVFSAISVGFWAYFRFRDEPVVPAEAS